VAMELELLCSTQLGLLLAGASCLLGERSKRGKESLGCCGQLLLRRKLGAAAWLLAIASRE